MAQVRQGSEVILMAQNHQDTDLILMVQTYWQVYGTSLPKCWNDYMEQVRHFFKVILVSFLLSMRTNLWMLR